MSDFKDEEGMNETIREIQGIDKHKHYKDEYLLKKIWIN